MTFHRSICCRWIAFCLLAALALLPEPARTQVSIRTPFLEKPYLQLGDEPALRSEERMMLVWQTVDEDGAWGVDVGTTANGAWTAMSAPTCRRIAVGGLPPHRIWSVALVGLKPGSDFTYRVRKNGKLVFSSMAHARNGARQPFRFVVFGDCGTASVGQKQIAYQTYLAKPDFVLITGDIVYNRGRLSEYHARFFPEYNADLASPQTGAPLLRSTLFLAAPGNHDILYRDLDALPDGLGYFVYLSHPRNGPPLPPGGAHTPTLSGAVEHQDAFLAAAGDAYPRTANYSFDYGNAHWLVLDANPYVDWQDPALRAWVAADLAAARKATWRFVAFHQPGFNSSKSHFEEQQMRSLSDVFEKGGVSLVFMGHVHNYQRTYPLHFDPKPWSRQEKPGSQDMRTLVDGTITLDKRFDGVKNTRPDGIIYLVTGGGGDDLYDPGQQGHPETWQPFTLKYIAEIHSLTQVDVDGKRLTVRQISADGAELDRFVVTK